MGIDTLVREVGFQKEGVSPFVLMLNSNKRFIDINLVQLTVKFILFVYPRDFYPFWSIMEIFFNTFRCHEWYSNLSIPRQKPNLFHHTDVFPSWNLRLLNLSPIFSMIQVCAGFCSVLLSGVSVPRAKWWMCFHLTIM